MDTVLVIAIIHVANQRIVFPRGSGGELVVDERSGPRKNRKGVGQGGQDSIHERGQGVCLVRWCWSGARYIQTTKRRDGKRKKERKITARKKKVKQRKGKDGQEKMRQKKRSSQLLVAVRSVAAAPNDESTWLDWPTWIEWWTSCASVPSRE